MEMTDVKELPQVEENLCIGCGNCANRCPTQAITLLDGYPQIGWEKCIGCSLCELQCPTMALHMRPRTEEEVRHPQGNCECAVCSQERLRYRSHVSSIPTPPVVHYRRYSTRSSVSKPEMPFPPRGENHVNLLKGGRVLIYDSERDEEQLIEGGAVAWRGDTIVAVGKEKHVNDRVRDFTCSVQETSPTALIMPGLICAHSHTYGALSRGMALPPLPPRVYEDNLQLVLRRLWWRLDRALDVDAVRLGAAVCASRAALSGVTTLIDHHSSPSDISGSLQTIAGAVGEVGLRSCLAYEVTGRNGEV